MNEIEQYIALIREAAPRLMIEVFTRGGCYQFFLILRRVFPVAVAFYDSEHVVTAISGRFYDIRGDITEEVNARRIAYTELDREPYWGKRYFLSDEFHLMPGPSEDFPE